MSLFKDKVPSERPFLEIIVIALIALMMIGFFLKVVFI